MSISKYRAFIKVAESGSLTKAAKQLGYSQPGISHMVDSLETEMGFPLGIDFVKMIFCGFLKLMIYLPNNLPILRAYKSLETLYSKAFGQFLIVSHLQ